MKVTFSATNIVSEVVNIDNIDFEYEMSEADMKIWYENAPALIDRVITAIAINLDRLNREREEPPIGD
jgi:hypothetical protein